MPALFVVTLFVSAALLFMVQPMVGKMVLPLLGGSPAAWNTCMVFFQGLLLLGYLYAHALSTRERPHRQPRLHLLVLLVTAGWLLAAGLTFGSPVPVFKTLAPQGQSYPMFGVLALLAVAIGLPFLVVSTSAPLFQRWFNYTGHPGSVDPYFLYAASNAGSLLSLLAYPLVIEPTLTLNQQAWVWAGGFLLLAALAYVCGQMVIYPHRPYVETKLTASASPPPSLGQKLRWVGFAFVPSSQMLGVTFYMTTDIASLPLLWLIPLGLYLVTFIIAFARTPYWFRPVIGNLSPVLTLLLVFVMVSPVMADVNKHFLALAVHCCVYFFTALLMHTELVRERPRDVRYLTQFFLLMSLGGVLGGVFNALVAPLVFPGAWEYPIAIAVGCFFIPVLEPSATDGRWLRLPGWAWDLLLPAIFLGLLIWWNKSAGAWVDDQIQHALSYCGVRLPFRLGGRAVGSWDMITYLVVYAVPCVVCFLFVDRPVRFGLCVAAILGVWQYGQENRANTLSATRSYFGILRVEKGEEPRPGSRDPVQFEFVFPITGTSGDDVKADGYRFFTATGNKPGADQKSDLGVLRNRYLFHRLSHGTTLHGVQAAGSQRVPVRDDLPILGAPTAWDLLVTVGAQAAYDPRQEPLTYYHRTGPVGHMVQRFRVTHPADAPMAMIGLGTGSVACYARPGQPLTFYEIDPSVVKLVEPPTYFTYLDDAKKRGARLEIVLGDARVKLEEQTDRKYGLLLVDAFSSDSIPVHLLTKQAVELYKSRLTDHGILGLHISNRHINLAPVCAKLAEECGLVSRVFDDDEEGAPGKTRSHWVVLAKTEADLGEELTGNESDTRYGAVAGGYGYQIYNHPWQPLKVVDPVPAWTDDYSDVLRVMRIEEIQWVRRGLGLPGPWDKKKAE